MPCAPFCLHVGSDLVVFLPSTGRQLHVNTLYFAHPSSCLPAPSNKHPMKTYRLKWRITDGSNHTLSFSVFLLKNPLCYEQKSSFEFICTITQTIKMSSHLCYHRNEQWLSKNCKNSCIIF